MTSLHCDATAYVSVLSIHNASTHSTSLATETAKDLLQRDTSGLLRMARRMLLLILVLVRSLRAVEPPGCRRPFVLLGVLPSLPPLWRARLTREGVVFAPCSPLVPGNPSSDKLRAWLLVRYERLLYVDADVMALANVDDMLAPAPPHVVVQAHHESDLVQAHCGVPLAQRSIGAFFSFAPSATTFTELARQLVRYSANAYVMKHFSEQALLACHFNNDSRRVLPCGYLFSINNPASTACRFDGRPPEICLRIHRRACERHAPQTLRDSCTLGGHQPGSDGCSALVRSQRGVCAAISAHASAHCRWRPDAGVDIRAVHFKGRKKPWALASEACAPVTLGTMRVGHAQARGAAPNRSQALLPLSPFAVHDSPVWRGEPRGHGECLVVNRTDAPRIHWADGSPIDARRCCTLELLLASIWYGHLTAEERLAL